MRAAWTGSDPGSRLTSIPGYLHSLSLFRTRIKNFFKMILSKCDLQLNNVCCAISEWTRSKGSVSLPRCFVGLTLICRDFLGIICRNLPGKGNFKRINERTDSCFCNNRVTGAVLCHKQHPVGQFEHYCSDIICGYWLNTSLSISRLLTFSGPIGLGANFQFFNNPWLCWNRGALINNRKKANLQGLLENAPVSPCSMMSMFSFEYEKFVFDRK